jgi:hypothetical protein
MGVSAAGFDETRRTTRPIFGRMGTRQIGGLRNQARVKINHHPMSALAINALVDSRSVWSGELTRRLLNVPGGSEGVS